MGPREKELIETMNTLTKGAEAMSIEGIEVSMNAVFLASIANSLAVIADKMTEGEWKDADTGSDETDSDKSE